MKFLMEILIIQYGVWLLVFCNRDVFDYVFLSCLIKYVILKMGILECYNCIKMLLFVG